MERGGVPNLLAPAVEEEVDDGEEEGEKYSVGEGRGGGGSLLVLGFEAFTGGDGSPANVHFPTGAAAAA